MTMVGLGTSAGAPVARHARTEALAPAEFVAALAAEALRHRAVSHPYLADLGGHGLPNPRWAMADFARQYYGYSRHFPRYLATVIARLEDPRHRNGLLENLTEESGQYEAAELEELARHGVQPKWIVGLPHPVLFQRLAAALGVETATQTRETESDHVACWREMFLAVLAHGSAAEAVGALGLGTENIVSTIYRPFVRAVAGLDLDPRDTVFFPLHCAVDDHHQATLQGIAADLAATPEGRRDLRRGMLKALGMRSVFWDWLHARALDPVMVD
jgi:pyrroloquinoline quinone (PQQ) biosynthesis protein C